MRIALISLHFSEYAYRLASSLAEQHEVLLIVGKENFEEELGRSPRSAQRPHLRIAAIPRRPLKNPLVVFNGLWIVTITRRFKPDVIHCQEYVADYLIGALLLLRNVPMVLTVHDHIPHTGQDALESPRRKRYRAYLRQQADAIIFHGEQIRVESEAMMPWLKGRTAAIPHGPLGQLEGPVNYSWQQGALLFFGRIEEYKGLKYFIEAVKLLAEQGCPVRAIIAGKGSDLDAHRPAITNHSAFELVERFINNDELAQLFSRVNIVVLPYTDATQSGVAAMAIRHGRPIVATNVGSIPELVRDGFNGLIVPPRDATALVAAIRSLVEDQPLAVRFGMNALSLADGELSWPAIANRTIEVYHAAVASQKAVLRNPNFPS